MKTLAFFLAFVLAGLAAGQEGSFDRSVTVSGPVSLDVKTDSGGIAITPGSSGSVHVHAVLKAEHGWLGGGDAAERIRQIESHPPIEQSGNQVRIGYVHDRELLRGISMRFEIQTPADTQVLARADSGGIRVAGVRGPVDCKTDSGGIRVQDVKAGVHAAADSGGIHMADIGGAVVARVDSGGVEATNVSGSIDAQTDSGSIRLSQTTPAPIRAKADSGGVTVRLAPKAGYDLNLETDSGRISVPEITVRSGFSSHHVQGKVGSGGPLVEIRAASGSVSVE